MKNSRRNRLNFSNGLFTFIMTLLGFSACERYGPDEYGTPYTTYQIKGKVVNSREQHISDIQVIIKEIINDKTGSSYLWDTLFTDSKGEFSIEKSAIPKDKYRIDFQDIENNIYKTDSTDIEMPNRGIAGKEIITVLKEKTSEEDGK